MIFLTKILQKKLKPEKANVNPKYNEFSYGNVMHVEMDFDQVFLSRPLPEMSQYKTPTKNLYLTGASTHPGGVFAASGYNLAKVVLKGVKGSWF